MISTNCSHCQVKKKNSAKRSALYATYNGTDNKQKVTAFSPQMAHRLRAKKGAALRTNAAACIQ